MDSGMVIVHNEAIWTTAFLKLRAQLSIEVEHQQVEGFKRHSILDVPDQNIDVELIPRLTVGRYSIKHDLHWFLE